MAYDFQEGGQCYATAMQAAQAAAAAIPSASVTSGTTVYATEVVATTFAGVPTLQWTYKPMVCNGAACPGGTPNVVMQLGYAQHPCNLVTMADTASMAWLVVAAWAAVYGARLLWKRGLVA